MPAVGRQHQFDVGALNALVQEMNLRVPALQSLVRLADMTRGDKSIPTARHGNAN